MRNVDRRVTGRLQPQPTGAVSQQEITRRRQGGNKAEGNEEEGVHDLRHQREAECITHSSLVSLGPPAASFEQAGGGKTVTGQCASHILPRLRLLQPYEQYGAVCIPHATLFPRHTSSSLRLTDVIVSFRTSVELLIMYSRIYYLS
ncbi:hypothetical protein K443DRAFT_681702 [Laccaria amethystina LaAM-08-1]|uniref:Uncharacterized protein n=1 Tax=Laccaria amethystina LaAM-08-1 TaxID=1095629 RepID=A0A0C9WX30_9AGAR|nr:hypothetical protein K443DRAFT_681702 [Laccaria amethystina LaAM-08-1]